MKDGVGVIVGRFQVNELHDGHLELFRQVNARHDRVLVFVGKHPAGLTKDNPLSFEARRRMIQAKFVEFSVIALPDVKTDPEWSKNLDDLIESNLEGMKKVTLYGGRDSFVPHYDGKHTPVELTLPIETLKISGTDIRNLFTNHVIESADFRAGMIHAAAQLWPVVLPTVDIAIFSSDYTEILLGRRKTELKWRFIGGHVERKHESAEQAARQEVLEEAGLDPNAMEYICSAKIPDWRYSTPDRGVMTTFFATTTMSMGAVAGDDINEVKWFKVNKLTADDIVDTHQVLYVKLRDWSVKKHIIDAKLGGKIYTSTERPESAGNTLRQAINEEEKTTGALRVTDPDPTNILPNRHAGDPTRIMG